MRSFVFKHFYCPTEVCGYELESSFFKDFDIADHFGTEAIRDTYERAFSEWNYNHVFMAELLIVLNHRGAFWYELHKNVYSDLYFELYRDLQDKMNNLIDQGKYTKQEVSEYYDIID